MPRMSLQPSSHRIGCRNGSVKSNAKK
uniref:Uncharacterized protein n=1 Tax=Rhizophora mucronata TaxID=61149 RepID=A0A2P2NEZ5_RHIMU